MAEYRTVKRFPAKIVRFVLDNYKDDKHCLVLETADENGEIFKTPMYLHTPGSLERTMKNLARLKYYGGLPELVNGTSGMEGMDVSVSVVKVISDDPRGKTFTNYEVYPPAREVKAVTDPGILAKYDWGRIAKPDEVPAANEGMPDTTPPYDWDGAGQG